MSLHVSKLEPVGFYAKAFQVNECTLGGPYLVGGMKGISLHRVVRTVHRMLDLASLCGEVVDVLITDLAKYFDVPTAR